MGQEDRRILIVGGGFAGIGMAIRLKQRGIEDFVLVERADGVGGTWTYNTYPECRCDIPSHLYSFSFAPNPEWTQTYSSQPEIRDYLEAGVDRFGIRDNIRTGVPSKAESGTRSGGDGRSRPAPAGWPRRS